jgi:hypothetical protein
MTAWLSKAVAKAQFVATKETARINRDTAAAEVRSPRRA